MVFDATIMIPVYNSGKYLEETLRSAINQTYSGEYEILAINDGSTDLSPQILNSFSDSFNNFRVLHQENKGEGRTRNRLLDEAKGEILVGLDSDDILNQRALEKVIGFYKKNPDIGFVYSNNNCIDNQGNLLYRGERSSCHEHFDELIYFANFVGHLRSYKKSFLGNLNFEVNSSLGTDWDFFMKMTPLLKKGHIPEFLYDYRIYGESTSNSTDFETKKLDAEDLVRENLIRNRVYNFHSNIFVKRVQENEHIIYFNHFVDNVEKTMSPKAKSALRSYFSNYLEVLKNGN